MATENCINLISVALRLLNSLFWPKESLFSWCWYCEVVKVMSWQPNNIGAHWLWLYWQKTQKHHISQILFYFILVWVIWWFILVWVIWWWINDDKSFYFFARTILLILNCFRKSVFRISSDPTNFCHFFPRVPSYAGQP